MLDFRHHWAVVAALTILSAAVYAEDAKQVGADAEAMQAMMAEMLQYAAPGEHHKTLDAMAGTFDFDMEYHMSPDAPWQKSSGQSVQQWVLGGRFLQQSIHTPPSDQMPMEFEGLGFIGYDNFAKQHVQLWMDSFMTSVIVLKGDSGETGNQFSVSGEVTRPVAGAPKVQLRWVYHIISDDKYTLEMWEPDQQGNEYLHGKITCTRAK